MRIALNSNVPPSMVRRLSSAPSSAAVTAAAAGSRVRMIAALVAVIRDCDQLSSTIAAAVASTARYATLSQVVVSVGRVGKGGPPVKVDRTVTPAIARAATVVVCVRANPIAGSGRKDEQAVRRPGATRRIGFRIKIRIKGPTKARDDGPDSSYPV